MFNNRYTKLALLTLAIATLIYILVWVVGYFTGVKLPGGLTTTLSLLGAGYLVYTFFASHVY